MQSKYLIGRLVPLCLFAFSSISLFSQAAHLSLFKRDVAQENKWNALRSNQKVAIIQYDPSTYDQLKQDDVQSLQIDLPTPHLDLKLNLVKNEIFAEGFFVRTDKEKSTAYEKGIYYKGKIDGQPNSVVAISFFDNEVIAVINESNGNKYVVGQSSAFRRGSFVVYDASKADAPASSCMSESLPGYADAVKMIKMPTALEQRNAGGCVNIYFELGQSVFANKGNTVPGATNYITGAFNIVSALYANDGVNVKISEVFVWTTAEPYAADASNALTQFGQAKHLSFNGQLAQLVRLKTGGSMSGIAWVNVLCYPVVSSSGAGPYSYAEVLPTYANLPTFSWTAEVITHELGHNLGSPHTQSCSWTGGPIDNCYTPEGSCAPGPSPTNGGTIMSYCHLTGVGINFANGFGPQPKALILSRINAAACVIACATGTTCNAPTGLSSTNITTNGATLNWAAVSGAVSYTVNYKAATSGTWIALASAATGTSLNIGSLSSGVGYDWQVRTNCSSGSSVFTQAQFTTTGVVSNCTTNPPAGLITSNIATTSATMSWSASSGASSYNLYIKASTVANWTLLLASTTSLSVNVTGLTSGVTYQWQVNANCTAGSSGFTQASFITLTTANCTSFPPSGLTSTNITTSGVTLSWTAVASATSYAVQYKLRSATVWTTANANVTATSITLSGLASSTIYDWQVRSNCSAGSSLFSAGSFTTASASTCPIPATLTTINITGTTATLNWNAAAGAFNYTLDLKTASDINWTSLIVTSSVSVNVSGLIGGTTYQWRIKTNCGSGSSGYAQAQFVTTGNVPVPCNAPISLIATGLTSTGATVSWGAAANALNYSVEYKVNTSSTWLVANAALASTTLNLSNLSANTIYDWRVKTNCSAGSSAYSVAQFTTSAVVSNTCPGSLDLTENGTTATARPIAFNTDARGQINPSGDIDYYSFVVTVGGSLTLNLTTLAQDYDLRLMNSSGSTMGLSQNGGTTSEVLNLTLAAGTYYARVYGWNGANSTTCYTFRIQANTASIEYNDLQAGHIFYNPDALTTSVFPNPATHTLNYQILGLKGPAELTITDLQGRQIMKALTKDYSSQLNISSLSAGFYFMRVKDENNKSNVVKFLKTL